MLGEYCGELGLYWGELGLATLDPTGCPPGTYVGLFGPYWYPPGLAAYAGVLGEYPVPGAAPGELGE